MGKDRQGLFYRIFRVYELYLHKCFFYKKIHCVGKENVPPEGTPVLFISNHQNCMCDPLAVVFTVRDRKTNFFVRGDIFSIHPWLTKIFDALAMSPAFRLDFDGKELLWKNRNMLKGLEVKLLNGDSVLMYPEGKHQNKHWLGDFSLGYTKLAFETAALGDFQKELWVVPCCNHYSAYKDIQQEVVVKFGTPISLKPFYELYQEKPRTAQRQINDMVRKQVLSLMLHVADINNYKAIDFLRHTYGRQFADKHGFKKDYLPDILQADRLLVEKLQEAQVEDAASVQEIYNDALTIAGELQKLKIRDDQLEKTPGWLSIGLSFAALVVLAPVWLCALWPNIIIYTLPGFVMRRIRDKMFYNSFLIGISSLITMPILYTLTFILVWVFLNFWIAFVYAIALPWLGLFAYYYWRFAIKALQNIRFRRMATTGVGRKLRDLRNKLFERLNILLQ